MSITSRKDQEKFQLRWQRQYLTAMIFNFTISQMIVCDL